MWKSNSNRACKNYGNGRIKAAMDRRASFARNKIGTVYGGCARSASICDCGGGRRGGKFQGSPSAGRLVGVGGGAAGELIRVRAGGGEPSAHSDQNGGFARVSGSGLAQVSMGWSPPVAQIGRNPKVLVRCRKLGELLTCLHFDGDARQGGVSAWREGGTPPNPIDLPPSMYRHAIFQDLGSISPRAFLCDGAQAGKGSQNFNRWNGVRIHVNA